MKHYHQLTREQRYGIYSLLKTGYNQSMIATVIGVHKSTISRELRRNRGGLVIVTNKPIVQLWPTARVNTLTALMLGHGFL